METCLIVNSKYFALIVVANTLKLNFNTCVLILVFYINTLAHGLPNKMGLSSASIDILLILAWLLFPKPHCLLLSGHMRFPQLFSLSIACHRFIVIIFLLGKHCLGLPLIMPHFVPLVVLAIHSFGHILVTNYFLAPPNVFFSAIPLMLKVSFVMSLFLIIFMFLATFVLMSLLFLFNLYLLLPYLCLILPLLPG